jgi:hypothetical protein
MHLNIFNAHVLSNSKILSWEALEAIDRSCDKSNSLAKTLFKRICAKRINQLHDMIPPPQRVVLDSCSEPGVMASVLHPSFRSTADSNYQGLGTTMSFVPARMSILDHFVGTEDRFMQLLMPRGAPPAIMPPNLPCNRPGQQGGLCSTIMDGNLHHCVHCSSTKYPLHQTLLGALKMVVRSAQCVSCQDTRLRDQGPGVAALFADTRIDGLSPVSVFVDVTNRSPFAKGGAASIMRNGHVDVTAPVRNAEYQKNNKCLTSATLINAEFVPFAVTHLGVMGKAACSLLKRLSLSAQASTGESEAFFVNTYRRFILSSIFNKMAWEKCRALSRIGGALAAAHIAARV